MPVRYDIAAQIPQTSGGGFDPLNMMAQLQGMDYRQRQNALADLQMQKLQREFEAQNAIRNMARGLNMSDPRVVNQIWAQDPEFARQIYTSQLAGLREQRMAEQAQAAAQATRARMGLEQREFEELKVPKASLERERERRLAEQAQAETEAARERIGLAKREFEEVTLPKGRFEAAREERAGRKLDLEINKETLDRDAKTLERLENFGAKVFNTNGRGYEDFRQDAIKQHPEFEKMLPPTYDPDALSGFIDNAANTREKLKSASEYEYREITDATGATHVVAIPKRAPRAGAIEIPGAAGAKPADFGFMPGPEGTGMVTRTNPRTGQAELVTPVQPGAAPANAMAAPPAVSAPISVPAAPAAPARGALIPSEIRPTAEAPVGSAAYNNKRFATEALDAVGFDAQTGKDRVSELIRKSTSGGMQAAGAGLRGFLGGSAPGMEAIAEIKPIVKDIILKKLNGKLGAGISNEDRSFIEGALGNLDDPSIPAPQRLASWNSAKQILMKYANTGQPALRGAAPADRPSLEEIFK